MSKIIKITPEHIEKAKTEFDKYLASAKLLDGKISFSSALTTSDAKAVLYFTEIAWLKMQTLIREFPNEIAWHGVAFRNEDVEKHEYVVTDILVYPQKVTGTSVDMDEGEYAEWLGKNLDDDRFFNIHFQAHSHVYMPTSPSSVDLGHQQDILDMLDTEEGFYIFAIWNKKGDRTIRIFDMKKNILFENADVSVQILNDGTGIESFLEEAKKLVREEKRTYAGVTPYKSAGSMASQYQMQCGNPSGKAKDKENEKGKPEKSEASSSKGKRVDNRPSSGKGKDSKSAYDYYDDLYGTSYYGGRGY